MIIYNVLFKDLDAYMFEVRAFSTREKAIEFILDDVANMGDSIENFRYAANTFDCVGHEDWSYDIVENLLDS